MWTQCHGFKAYVATSKHQLKEFQENWHVRSQKQQKISVNLIEGFPIIIIL